MTSLGAPNSSNHWNNFTEIPQDADTSQFPFPTDIWVMRPPWEVAVKVATIAPIVIVGIVGNGSLIHAIVRTKSLRTTTNLLILNMAIADFGTSLLCPWMFVCVDVFQNYMFAALGCKFDGFLLQAMTLVAVLSLSAVSYDRVCAIVLNCSGKLSIRSARILILVSWIVALAVAVPLAFFRKYYERQWMDYLETFCAETKTAYPYWHIFVGLSVWTPLAIMAVCYTTILIKLDRYETHALKSKHPIVVKYKGRVARILALVVLAFIICRVPFTALVIQRAQMSRNFDDIKVGQAGSMYVLWYVSRYLVFVNAALNPLLYGCTSGSLRQELASHPPLSWLVATTSNDAGGRNSRAAGGQHRRKEQARTLDQLRLRPPERLDVLKPRSACIRLDRDEGGVAVPRELPGVPSISSSLAQSKTSIAKSECRLYKKLRINSIVK